MQRPNIKDIDAAIRVFYGNGYVSNTEIREIFGVKSDASIARIKKPVLEEEVRLGVPRVVPFCLNTKVAFEVWGIDVPELVKSRDERMRLGL